jgi:hypothetical protein
MYCLLEIVFDRGSEKVQVFVSAISVHVSYGLVHNGGQQWKSQ